VPERVASPARRFARRARRTRALAGAGAVADSTTLFPPHVTEKGIDRTVLPNGLTVLSEPYPGVRSIAIGAWVRAASMHEKRDEMGVSHMLEHLVFKGTKNRSAKEIASALESLGGSLDVSPTVLGLIGRPYETMFFGRDLLHDPPGTFRALINHDRDVGMFEQDRLVVLGLQKTVEFYQGDPKIAEIQPLTQLSPNDLELEKDAEAIYQVADELYMKRHYHLDAGK